MPARSEAQQRLMGMALAAKRGKGHFNSKIQSIADSMTERQLHDFAATKHKGLPEKKADIMGPSKIPTQGPVPSSDNQKEDFSKYLNLPGVDQKPARLESVYSSRVVPGEERVGATTPAAALAGVYGKDTAREIASANTYNKLNNYPLITKDILQPTGVYTGTNDKTFPQLPITSISNNPVIGGDDYDENSLLVGNIVNGLQPIKPRVNIDNIPRGANALNVFSKDPSRAVMPVNEVIEHEIGGHRVYDKMHDAKKRMPINMRWPGSFLSNLNPYQNRAGEAVNGLAAIQRDSFQNNGARYSSPEAFSSDLNGVLTSPDIEKAMTDKGWNRADSRRLIRGMVPMESGKRKEYMQQAARAIPGIVKNNPSAGNVKTSEEKKSIVEAITYCLSKKAFQDQLLPRMLSQSLPRQDIISGMGDINDYFKSLPSDYFNTTNNSSVEGDFLDDLPDGTVPTAVGAFYAARLARYMHRVKEQRKAMQQYQQYRTT